MPAGTVDSVKRPLQRDFGPTGGNAASAVHSFERASINSSNDGKEQEADRVAEQITQTAGAPVIQRKCALCPDDDDEEQLQRKEVPGRAGTSDLRPGALDLVHEVLQSPGQALDTGTRSFMESRFGQDFGRVRIHTDARAAESARSVNALAYTVGSNIVFTHQQYQPASLNGRKLLAHELTHIVQQGGIPQQVPLDRLTLDSPDSALERNARHVGTRILAGGARAAGISSGKVHSVASAPIVSRADPDAVGYTMRMGLSARTGLQFFPTNVTDTQVGPVSVQGGLLSGGASRLNVIIGENMTLRTLAGHLLPLWTTATPFTPPGAGAPLPLDIITQDELAQGLLVYNQTYLPVPAMTNWRAGLRFPLPVEVDEGTGMATLHPLQIRALAGGFNAAWAPLLDTAATANAAVPAATLTTDVTAFLGREPTTLARGIHLGARALTNAVAELPFIREAFRQLGPASFDVALAFMDNLVNREISLLAAQRNGAAILDEIRNALATAPAAPTAAQQASLTRANLMLGLVAGVVPQAPPGAARNRAPKTITVDTLKLDGSNHNPATDVAMANSILSQCNVRVVHGMNVTATAVQTTGWIGNTDLRAGNNCMTPSAEERALFQTARTAVGLNARFQAFFVASISGINASGYSCQPAAGMAPIFRNRVVVENSGDTATLAHELGHILIDLGPHTPIGLMSARPAPPAMRLPQISDAHCTRLYNHA